VSVLLPPAAGLPPHARWLAGRYEFLRELGRGGTAVVYLARERATGREVAVKLVEHAADDGYPAARIVREARLAAGLRHPNIVGTLAVEDGEAATALVTEYVAGGTLRAALRAQAGGDAPWPYARVAAVLRDVAGALAHAHARRVVHRDVKPENIFLAEPEGRALLGDFGIARRIGPDALPTLAGGAAGTPSYMAPEQVAGLAEDERTDVYALGLVGWELLAGRRPWQGETLYGVLHKQQHEPLPDLAALRPDIPAYLLAAIDGATAKDPAGRWRDGAAFLARLTPTPARLPPLADPDAGDHGGATVRFAAPGAAAPAAGARSTRVRRLGVGAAVAMLGAVGLAVATREPERRPAPGARTFAAAAVGSVAGADPIPARRRGRPTPGGARGAAGAAPRVPDSAGRRPGSEGAAAGAARRFAAAEARADARAEAAYDALLAALRRSAGGGREPRAARALQDEQRRWRVERDAGCRRSAAAAADPAPAAAACRISESERRSRALTARGARFDVPDR
jgi:hypothetical protein